LSVSSPTILWFLVVVFISVSCTLLGMALGKQPAIDANPPLIVATQLQIDQARYTLMSQTFLQLLASYCTLMPVLAYNIKKRKLSVNHYVFYFSTVASILTAIAAPIVFQVDPNSIASNLLNFISNMFSIVTATQLAGGVMKLGSGIT
jgi:hypothetical protein